MKAIIGQLGAIVAVIILQSGCVSYNQLMVNATGELQRCGSYGQGLIGVAGADKIQKDCLNSLRAAGYLEVEKAGVVGIIFTEQMPTDTLVRILNVRKGSPAEHAGVASGDILLAVNSQAVRRTKEAQALCFGLAGEIVELQVRRGELTLSMAVQRGSYASIFGYPKR